MKNRWNDKEIALLECMDDNENYQEVQCHILLQSFLKHLESSTKDDLLNKLNSKKEFYLDIERIEDYNVVCSSDLELQCQKIFTEMIEERLKGLINYNEMEIFSFTDDGVLNALVELDEKKSIVLLHNYALSKSFISFYISNNRKKKIDSILKND